MKVGLMVVRILTDAAMVVSLGWLTNLAVMKVGLMVERIPTDPETAASLDWLTNLGSLSVHIPYHRILPLSFVKRQQENV